MKSLVPTFFLVAVFFLISCEKQAPIISQNAGAIEAEIGKIVEDINKGKYGETHSLIVYQNDKLISENYFEPFDANKPHYQYSVTKSFTSILIGIAIDKGYIQSVDQKLLDFFPEYTDVKNLDRRKKAITLKDLLAMRAGFKWDEWTYSYLDERNDANKLIRSSDMVKFMLDLPMADEPGSRFLYNSGATMLLSGIIQKVYGETAEEFAKEFLFKPLGINNWDWEQGAKGLSNSGWGLHLLPIDMASMGRLVLKQGNWEGQQLLPSQWIGESIRNRGNQYGYQWWLGTAGGSFSARGWGGQYIFIVPTHNMVIVTTAGNFNNGHRAVGVDLLNRIVNAIED